MTSERMIQVPESTLRLWADRLKEGGAHGWEDRMATVMQDMLATQPAAGEPVAWQERAGLRAARDALENGRDDFESALSATQPAVGQPVAHRLVGVQVNGEWKEIKGKWVDGAPIAEMVEGVEEGWCRVELAFSAPPAAAHGDEAVRAKLCEAYESGYQDGQKWPDSYSIQADKDKVADALIAAMRAQAGEGGE